MSELKKVTLEDVLREHGAFIRRALATCGVPAADGPDAEQAVALDVAQALSLFDASKGAAPVGCGAIVAARATGPSLFDASKGAAPEAQVRDWLFVVSKYHARTYRRRALQRREVALHQDDLATMAKEEPTVEEVYEAAETADRLSRMVDALRPERRAVLVAHVFRGLTMPEVGAVLGVRLNTAWNRYRLALEDLRPAVRCFARDMLATVKAADGETHAPGVTEEGETCGGKTA